MKEGTTVQVRVTGDLGMAALLGDVAAFHAAGDVPVLAKPSIPAADRQSLREKLIREEVREYVAAVKAGDLVEVADALGDIIYVCVGAALEFGIPLDRVWAEIQRSNMAKVDPASGKMNRRADGKILKPEGWTPPNVKAALETA